jgi:hypothetical protein
MVAMESRYHELFCWNLSKIDTVRLHQLLNPVLPEILSITLGLLQAESPNNFACLQFY